MESEEIKQKILSEIRRTELQIEEYKEMTIPEAPDCAIGRVSRMDAINNRSVTEASLRQARGKLESLQRVSAQLGTKEFGLCMKCKQPIPIGRILFRPESLFCVNCAQ
jgi:DnaK suppressor protein